MLDAIPKDIFYAIIDQIPRNRDRSRISRVSKKLYALVLPILYGSITVRSRNESDLTKTDIHKYLRTARRHYFAYVKSILFVARIESNDQFRCIHNKILREADEAAIEERNEDLVSKVDNLVDMMPNIRPLFRGLQDNQLRKFSWHLGTCLPKDILGPGGYLPTKQSEIEELSLITSDPCILPKEDWEYQISLDEFKSLRKFSWSGGLSKEYFDALRDMFKVNSTSLEVLKIDLIDWWDAQYNWCAFDGDSQLWIRDHNFFGERVLELAPGEIRVLFPSLRSLSLSSVQFLGSSLEMAHAFNMSRLQSLNLRDCPHTGSLLRKIVESGETINLRSLELVIRHNNSTSFRKEEDEDWIVPFLDSFKGLTSLRLLVLNGRDVSASHQYWPSIFHHKETLTRLVYHELCYDYGWVGCNINMEFYKVLDLFTQMNLECWGVCLSPLIPKEQIFSQLTVAQLSSLKFLCLRSTGIGPEFEHHFDDVDSNGDIVSHKFASWAFKTFPNLLFIALGDFSYGCQFASTQEILHRYPFPGVDSADEYPDLQSLTIQDQSGFSGFRKLRPGDLIISRHVDQFREVLEACPEQPLYRKDF